VGGPVLDDRQVVDGGAMKVDRLGVDVLLDALAELLAGADHDHIVVEVPGLGVLRHPNRDRDPQ